MRRRDHPHVHRHRIAAPRPPAAPRAPGSPARAWLAAPPASRRSRRETAIRRAPIAKEPALRLVRPGERPAPVTEHLALYPSDGGSAAQFSDTSAPLRPRPPMQLTRHPLLAAPPSLRRSRPAPRRPPPARSPRAAPAPPPARPGHRLLELPIAHGFLDAARGDCPAALPHQQDVPQPQHAAIVQRAWPPSQGRTLAPAPSHCGCRGRAPHAPPPPRSMRSTDAPVTPSGEHRERTKNRPQ